MWGAGLSNRDAISQYCALLSTDLFRDLESMKPLTIEEQSSSPFDNCKLQSIMEALKEGGSTTDQYIAGGNVAWSSPG